jgi:hypothetical protein
LRLPLALLALALKFFQEAFHLVTHVLMLPEADLILTTPPAEGVDGRAADR